MDALSRKAPKETDPPPSLVSWLASSGLAVGADLTSASLPIFFFLDKTILEILMYNEMRRVDLLLAAADAPTPLERLKKLLSYYFSCCVLEEFGKKPLTSRPGETIGCTFGSETHFHSEQVLLYF